MEAALGATSAARRSGGVAYAVYPFNCTLVLSAIAEGLFLGWKPLQSALRGSWQRPRLDIQTEEREV
jgi:hypothetical protein